MALILILLLSSASYFVGVGAVLRGDYKPSVYSRIIWFLIAINGLLGLFRLSADFGTLVLSAVQTTGSLLILLAAFKYSILEFKKVEWIATALLVLSLGVWLIGDFPALNVGISLVAHFIGGIPTLRKVYLNPKSEHTFFWGYFAVASLIALVLARNSGFSAYMFPLYNMSFNSVIVILSLRNNKT